VNSLLRYWNQNRKKIILTVAIIALLIISIQTINSILRINRERNGQNIQNDMADERRPIQSVITGEKVSEEKTNENVTVIEEFVKYCNQNEFEKAYQLLTDECKEEFNNDVNLFINNYCKLIFNTRKGYNLDLWINKRNNYTYKIKYYEDNILATGGTNLDKNFEDYITITEKNNKSKISVNGFVSNDKLNCSQEVNGVKITVDNRRIYKDYEKHIITVKNNTSKTIMITERKDDNDICLIDTNNVEYPSFSTEIPFFNLSLMPGEEKQISIKFNKIYSLYRTIEKIEFKNIILDKEKLEANSDENIEKIKITIEI